jgi:hypothetical protein
MTALEAAFESFFRCFALNHSRSASARSSEIANFFFLAVAGTGVEEVDADAEDEVGMGENEEVGIV